MQVKEIKNGRLREQILYNKELEIICQSQLWAIIINIWKTFNHISFLRDHFHVIHIPKITTKRYNILDGLYVNEISFCTINQFIL
jgi:hypothetical protein